MNNDQLGVIVWAVFVLGPAALRELQLRDLKRKIKESEEDGRHNEHPD